MKKMLLCAALAAVSVLVSLPGTVWGQLGPRIDPAFRAQEFYQPVEAIVTQLRGGARLVVGPERVDQHNVAGLARLLPSGEFDEAFAANVSTYYWQPQAVVETADGKLLVLLKTLAVIAGHEVQTVVRLQADGTYDAGFHAPTVGMTPRALLALPDGRVLLGGIASYNVRTSPTYNSLVRLNADGTLDPTYQANVQDPEERGAVLKLVRQPDGKVLLAGRFTKVGGESRPGLARLLPDGAVDLTFVPALAVPNSINFSSLTLQPDGKVLIADFFGFWVSTGKWRVLVRLLPNGALDPAFEVANDLGVISSDYPCASPVAVADDGLIYVGFSQGQVASWRRGVVRLLPSGEYDPDWQFQAYDAWMTVRNVQLVPGGQVLASGHPALYSGQSAPATAVALLDARGAYQPDFAPLLHQPGTVASLALQPDGRILVAGQFTYAQGHPVQGLARLEPNGALDVTFSTRTRLGGPDYTGGWQTTVQSDGRILVSGDFSSAGGLSRSGIARFLPDGILDNSFNPPSRLPVNAAGYRSGALSALAVQPSGKILVANTLTSSYGQVYTLARLLPDGQLDAGFNPALPGGEVTALLVLPDASMVLTNSGAQNNINHLLPDGQLDYTFAQTTAGPDKINTGRGYYYSHLARYPDGRLLVGGYFHEFQGHPTNVLARLLPDGHVDPTFTVADMGEYQRVAAMAIQPNGRIVLSTGAPGSLVRLLPDGTVDNSFTAATLPQSHNVLAIGVQPDGGILVGGTFSELLSQYQLGLARLLDNNVLAISSQMLSASVRAWPVPAHDVLHLHLESAGRPRQVQLLDALGRVRLSEPVRTADFMLNTTALPAGTYLLRVDYEAAGAVVHQVVID